MIDSIKNHIRHSIETKEKVLKTLVPRIEEAGKVVVDALKKGNKVFFFGNGGSASDAQHLAAELVGRFEKEREALPSIALTTDTSIITAVANDYAYDVIFERQLHALGKKGDVAVGISTSGKSANVNRGITKAKSMGIKTIAFTGKDGGTLAKLADIPIIVPSDSTASIQESHIMIGQILCRLVDEAWDRAEKPR